MTYKSTSVFLYFFIGTLLMISCIPKDMKEQMNQSVKMAQSMFADSEFKKAIGHIEIHKLRTGSYPSSLRDLQYLTVMDSAMFEYLQYQKLGSGYELNINFQMPTLTGNKQTPVKLEYPADFWKGLGCVRSNVKSVH